MSREGLNYVAAAVLSAALVCPGFGAEKSEKYQAYLSPMPHNDAMHANFSGKGGAIAVLDGDTISLNGTFTGLASTATKAHLGLSKAAGIPGELILDVTVTPAVEGKVAATVKLDKTQIEELKKGRLYIQIDSEKAPKGNLWGWLFAEHETAGQDVPQQWPWFQPEFSVRTK